MHLSVVSSNSGAVKKESAKGLRRAMDDHEYLKRKLALLQAEHRELNGEIETLENQKIADQMFVHRLKKRKLTIKDEMTRIENELYPDIIA